MRPLILFAATFAAALLASNASARKEEPYQPSPPTISATPFALVLAGFDANGDLAVSKAEFDAGVARSFAGADGDGDGTLGLIEFTGWSEANLGNIGALPGQFDFDRDGDDHISRAEFQTLFAARFASLDKDQNAALSRKELITIETGSYRRGRERNVDSRLLPPGQRPQ